MAAGHLDSHFSECICRKLAFHLSELEKRMKWLECQVFVYYPMSQRKQDVGMFEHVHSTSVS